MKPAVLLVDDEKSICSALKRTFKQHYAIFEANNGEQALDILYKNTIDVVISDQRMPGMTGTELLLQVKNRYPNIGRVMLSGYSDPKALTEAINEASVHRFIHKPWNDQQLLDSIKKIIPEKPPLSDDNRLNSVRSKKISSYHSNLKTMDEALTKKKIQLEKNIKDNSLNLSQHIISHSEKNHRKVYYQTISWPEFLHFNHKGIINIASTAGYRHDLFNWYLFSINEKISKAPENENPLIIDLFCDSYMHNRSTESLLKNLAYSQKKFIFRIPFNTVNDEYFKKLLTLTYKTKSDLLLSLDKRVIDMSFLTETSIKYIEMDGSQNSIENSLLTEKRLKLLKEAKNYKISTILNNAENLIQHNYGKNMGFNYF